MEGFLQAPLFMCGRGFFLGNGEESGFVRRGSGRVQFLAETEAPAPLFLAEAQAERPATC